MKTLTVKFIIDLGDETIESDEREYEYYGGDEFDEANTDYEDVLEEIEYDKIAWVFNTVSIRHEIISNK